MIRKTSAFALALALAGLATAHAQTKPTVVLVHGAFADSSSWNGVVADLTLKARIPGADQETFEKLAAGAKANCPVSKLLNAEITLDAALVD